MADATASTMARSFRPLLAALLAVGTFGTALVEAGPAGATMHHYATGEATWYAAPASGPYPARLVCASASLRFGTKVMVKNLRNGRTTTCVVGDHKPYNAVRIVDLSTGVFARLAPLGAGVIKVAIAW